MIEQLVSHLAQDTVDQITNIIYKRYRDYIKLTNSLEFIRLFSDEYAPHKKQHSISWAISSAFPSENRVGDLDVSCLNYGRGHTRPVLSNEYIELHILNSSTDFNSRYLLDRYTYNVNSFSEKKLFCFVKFYVVNQKLKKVELCLPDEHGIIINSELLLGIERLKLVA